MLSSPAPTAPSRPMQAGGDVALLTLLFGLPPVMTDLPSFRSSGGVVDAGIA